MNSATYKVLRFLFPLLSGLWFKFFYLILLLSSIGLFLCHRDSDSNGPRMLKNTQTFPSRPVLTCRGCVRQIRKEMESERNGTLIMSPHILIILTWRRSKEDEGNLLVSRVFWRIEDVFFVVFPSPFSGMEPGTCPGVLVQWRRTNLVMFLTLGRPMGRQTRWCHRLSRVSHWAAASLAP